MGGFGRKYKKVRKSKKAIVAVPVARTTSTGLLAVSSMSTVGTTANTVPATATVTATAAMTTTTPMMTILMTTKLVLTVRDTVLIPVTDEIAAELPLKAAMS